MSFSETFRTLAALTEIGSGERMTQRALAARLGISLGLANKMLRQMESAKLIKVNPRDDNRYVLTQAGELAITQLAASCAGQALPLLGGLREEVRKRVAKLTAQKRRNILLCGGGALAELAYAAARNAGMKVAGVVSEAPINGARVAGERVLSVERAAKLKFDAALATGPRETQFLRKSFGRKLAVVSLLPLKSEAAR